MMSNSIIVTVKNVTILGGIYRSVETVDYFVKSESSNDVLVITLCENRD